jgi:hypothetical protein
MRQHCCQCALRSIAFVLILPMVVSAQTTQNGDSAAQPVPDWLAWKMFHQSLAYYAQRSPESVNQMLAAQFGLTRAQAAGLLSAGQSFDGAIKSIDDGAKAEASRRYPDIVGSATPPSGRTTPRRTKMLPSGPPKTVRERAIEDGLYAEVEAKKQSALDNHIKALTSNIGPSRLAQIRNYLQSSIAPRIKTFTDRKSLGSPTRGMPPNITHPFPASGR